MGWFEGGFGYDTPDKMLQTLHNLKSFDSYNQLVALKAKFWYSQDVNKNPI